MAEAGHIEVIIDGKTEKLEKSIKSAKSSLMEMGSTLGIAFGVQQVAKFTSEVIKLAAEGEGVRNAFAAAGEGIDTLNVFREATRNTVADIELMKNAMQAKNFKIPMDVLAKGMEFAQKRASQTGQSVDYLVNSFTTGLGRKSVMILDNLGISASQLNEEVARTGDFMTAVGNIVDKELKNMGDVALTTADKTAQMNAAYANFKEDIGRELIKIGNSLANTFEDLSSKALSMFGIMQDGESKTSGITKAFQILGAVFKTFITIVKANYTLLKSYFELLLSGGKIAIQALKQISQGDFAGAWDSIKAGSEEAFKDVSEDWISIGKDLADIWTNMGPEVAEAAEKTGVEAGEAVSVGIIEALEKRKSEIEEAMKKAVSQQQIDALRKKLEAINLELEGRMGGIETDRGIEPEDTIRPEDIEIPGLDNLKVGDDQIELLEFFDELKYVADEVNAAFANAFNSLSDSMAEAIVEGKDFGDALNQILMGLIKQLISAALRAMMLKAVLGMTGGVGGGLFSAMGGKMSTGLPGFAAGGMAFTPTVATVAEREPEVITPLSKMGMGGQTITIEGKTRGDEIYWSNKRHSDQRKTVGL